MPTIVPTALPPPGLPLMAVLPAIRPGLFLACLAAVAIVSTCALVVMAALDRPERHRRSTTAERTAPAATRLRRPTAGPAAIAGEGAR